MRGHGRELIQLGVPVADAPLDVDNVTASLKGRFSISLTHTQIQTERKRETYICLVQLCFSYVICLSLPVIITHEISLIELTDKNVEPIPSLFQDIIERMAASQVMTVKPDACIVDFYNEVTYMFLWGRVSILGIWHVIKFANVTRYLYYDYL